MSTEVLQGTLDLMVLIKSRWGVSENNRKAKFYELTARGRRQIHEETRNWETTVAVMARFLAKTGDV